MKKLIAFILVIAMCLGASAFTVGAAQSAGLIFMPKDTYSGTCGTNLSWSLNTSTDVLSITGTGAMDSYSYCAPWYGHCSYITKVEIASGVTSIGGSAFRGCYNLKSINIPDSVTSIGSYAFRDCSKLTSINIPDSVTAIGGGAFRDCSKLTSITIPDSVTFVGDSAFYNCSGLTSVTVGAGVTAIGESAFYGCTALTKVNITDVAAWCAIQFEDYDDNPLLYANNLYLNGNLVTELIIPDSITSIGSYAFSGCSSVTSITIPDSITSIGSYAFYYCSRLTSVTIPDSVTSIGSYAFRGCSKLTSINIPDSVTAIGSDAFSYCSGLTSINIPDSVTSIGSYAFRDCSKLTSITIPDSVTAIGSDAFYGTGYYNDSTNWENNVLYIGNHLIEAKTDLSGAYTIKSGTITVANEAFSGCSSVTGITIPDSVTSIGDSAFYNCSALTSVTIGAGVTAIGNNAFYGCTALTKVNITDVAAWCAVQFENSYANPLYYAKNLYLNGSLVTELVIPAGVTSISPYAFYTCTSLASVTVPDSVTAIGIDAFDGCSGLTKVNITDVAAWCAIQFEDYDDNPLYYAKNLYLNGNLVTELIIPDSVTAIGDGAFYNCDSIISITIPDSVTSIGYYAFESCLRLETVYYEGSKNKWNDVEIDSGNEDLTSAMFIFSSDRVNFTAEHGSLSFTEVDAVKGTMLSDIAFPEVTADDGYRFVGWDKTEGVIEDGMVVNAVFERVKFYIVFKAEDGSVISQQTVMLGFTAIAPRVPQREGYKSLGWADEDGNIVKSFSNISKDMTLTAAYEQIMVKISFAAELGSLSFTEIEVPYGTELSNITFPAVTPVTGYHFTGWDMTDGVIKAETVVTAQFDIDTYTVTFKGADGAVLSQQTVSHGGGVTVPTIPQREGYTIVGWQDVRGNIVSDFGAVTGNSVYTAAYEQIMVKVNFKAELGSLSFTETEVAYGSYLEDLNYPDVSPAIGYLHTGWDISEGEVTEEITVNAKFELKTYTVIFMGVDGTTLSQQAVKHGFAATVPAVPKFEGYVFDCWADSNGNIISEFDSIIADITVIACYVEGEEAKHFEFAEGADTTNVVVSTVKEQVYFKAGGMTAEDIEALFDGAEISITKANGTTATGTALIGTGAVITSTINGVSESRTVVVLGDINGDGRVTAADYAQVLNCAKGKSALNALKKEAANVIAPGSATINAADYASVLAFAMGKTQKFNSAVV